MTRQRRQHRGECKANVVLEALRGERTLNEMAADSGVHPLQLTQWKKVAFEGLPTLLSSRRGPKQQEEEALQAALSQQIGPWKVERDWLKKKWALSVEQKRAVMEPAPPQLSIRRQCAVRG